MADIFLSYAHEDQAQARMLADLLTTFGWHVFWDREILAGAVFDDVIQQQLDQAKCVVCLWSVHSVNSQWVRAEAEEGANRNMLVSVLIEDVRLPIAFRRIQAAKLFHWSGSAEDEQLKDVVRAVKFVVDKPPQEFDTVASAPAPVVASVGSAGAAAAPARAPIASAAVPIAPTAVAPTAQPAARWSAGTIAAVLGGVVILGLGGWLYANRGSGTANTNAPQPAPGVNQSGREPAGAVPAPVSDDELLARARQVGEALGHGKIAAARSHFTPQLEASPAATQWRQRLSQLGDLVEVEPPVRSGGTGDLREVRVVMRHQNESIAATLTFNPDGKVCAFEAPNSNYRAGCR